MPRVGIRQTRRGLPVSPLLEVLRRHDATAVSQLDAFEAYVAEAETAGPEHFPLYRWTKATLDDPGKRAKHAVAFALRIGGAEVYDLAAADALERDLASLIGGGAVIRVSRHDTNPVHNLPVPPEYRA